MQWVLALVIYLQVWAWLETLNLKWGASEILIKAWIHAVHEQGCVWTDLDNLGLLFKFCSRLHTASIFDLNTIFHPAFQSPWFSGLHTPSKLPKPISYIPMSHNPSCASPLDIHWFNTGCSKPLPAPTHLLTWADTPVHQQKDWWDATTHLRNCWQLLLQHAAQQQGPVLYHKVSRWVSKWAICWKRMLSTCNMVDRQQLIKQNQQLNNQLNHPSTHSLCGGRLCLQSLFLVNRLYWSFGAYPTTQ